MKFFLCVIGMVLFLEGLPYAAFPDRMKSWIRQLLEMPDATLRILGFVMMASGLVLVTLGRG
jgi:uncharacterized protein YjeT (DUF2065 family)